MPYTECPHPWRGPGTAHGQQQTSPQMRKQRLERTWDLPEARKLSHRTLTVMGLIVYILCTSVVLTNVSHMKLREPWSNLQISRALWSYWSCSVNSKMGFFNSGLLIQHSSWTGIFLLNYRDPIELLEQWMKTLTSLAAEWVQNTSKLPSLWLQTG